MRERERERAETERQYEIKKKCMQAYKNGVSERGGHTRANNEGEFSLHKEDEWKKRKEGKGDQEKVT